MNPRLLFVLCVGLAVAGCHHIRPAKVEGSSAFTFVEPPPPPAPRAARAELGDGPREPVDVMSVAAPIEPLAKPLYPPSALGREKLPVTVGVHIVVNSGGRVGDVRTSLSVISTPTPRSEEFRSAVEDALAQWRFRPAELRRLAPTKDLTGKPAWMLVSREKTDCTFEVSFVFQSTGEVLSSTATP